MSVSVCVSTVFVTALLSLRVKKIEIDGEYLAKLQART